MLENADKTKDAVVQWIRAFFSRNAPDASAVIGISGGKDSSVAAALCAEALGKARVVGVMMPDGQQTDIEDSYALIKHLGIPGMEINIHNIISAVKWEFSHNIEVCELCGQTKLSKQARVNLPPRIRMAVLYALAQMLPHGGLVVNTCNRSEDYVGYSTKFGDAAGDFSPLADFTMHEVLQLGKVLKLPETLIYKVPSDGLSGLTDEDNLGFTYDVLDSYIENGICPDADIKEKIDALHQRNLHKLQPIPFFQKDSKCRTSVEGGFDYNGEKESDYH